jgi:hypothetical protein
MAPVVTKRRPKWKNIAPSTHGWPWTTKRACVTKTTTRNPAKTTSSMGHVAARDALRASARTASPRCASSASTSSARALLASPANGN